MIWLPYTEQQKESTFIIRTRGHRLEGIWHSGSPMGMIINGKRIHVLVPLKHDQSSRILHSLLECDEPALVIEVLMATD
jgi:hypothetical protein